MTNITDLAERRRLRGRDECPTFNPGVFHVTVTAPTADKPIEYVYDFAPATYAGLMEMRAQSPPTHPDRHTVDIDRNPMSVEDEWLEAHLEWARAKRLGLFTLGVALGFVLGYWRVP